MEARNVLECVCPEELPEETVLRQMPLVTLWSNCHTHCMSGQMSGQWCKHR